MDIKEIALKHSREYLAFKLGNRKGLDVAEIVCDDEIYAEIVDELAQQFEALIAEIAKQNEPVAFTNSAQLGYVTSGQHQDIPLAMWSRNTSYSGADIPLYTFPPTAEQIANETAEACARVYLDTYDLTDIAEAIRSGAWKEFKQS